MARYSIIAGSVAARIFDRGKSATSNLIPDWARLRHAQRSWSVLWACVLSSLAHPPQSPAGEPITVRVRISDHIDHEKIPEYLRPEVPNLLLELRKKTEQALESVQRVSILSNSRVLASHHLEISLLKTEKLYRNIYFFSRTGQQVFGRAPRGALLPSRSEKLSMPVLSQLIECQLTDRSSDRLIWSELLDTTAFIAHNPEIFLLNPYNYPGMNPPELLERYMADFTRLRHHNAAAERMLTLGDRWYVSSPGADMRKMADLIYALPRRVLPSVDRHLPVRGIVTHIETDTLLHSSKIIYINEGAVSGLRPKLKLKAFRSGIHLGDLEVVWCDSFSAALRIRKLRNQSKIGFGEILAGDLVISNKR